MGGHEANTESIPMRCIFLVTLFTTLYGFIILNDNWPKTAIEVGTDGKVSTLKQLLESMDAHYNLEINVHDHDVHLMGNVFCTV